MKLKDSGNLLVNKKESKFTKTLEKLELFPIESNYIETGYYVMLANLQTKGYLVVDLDDKNPNHEFACAVTTSTKTNFPCPRSLIEFQKFDKKASKNEVVNYGEKVYLKFHSKLDMNLYLYSSMLTPQVFSKYSRNQEVLATQEQNYNCAFVLEHLDSSLRYSAIGQPVSLKDPFIIRHCATGQLLATDFIDYNNDYGREFEVCCSNFMTTNKYQTLNSEREGRLMVDTKTRTEKDQNLWMVIDNI